MTALPPGSTIGILGGGQLGRMLAIAAARLGYKTHVFDPDAGAPAAQIASRISLHPMEIMTACFVCARLCGRHL